MIGQRPWRSSCACKLIDVNLHALSRIVCHTAGDAPHITSMCPRFRVIWSYYTLRDCKGFVSAVNISA